MEHGRRVRSEPCVRRGRSADRTREHLVGWRIRRRQAPLQLRRSNAPPSHPPPTNEDHMAVTTTTERSAGATAIRPFTIEIAEAELEALRGRVAATRWPDKETVPDHSQGVQLATIQALARYWATDYDWRRCEARLNALPQFPSEIDGLDMHFIHVRSQHEDALPLIVTHGWPGSVIEQLKIIDPLANPTAYGRR